MIPAIGLPALVNVQNEFRHLMLSLALGIYTRAQLAPIMETILLFVWSSWVSIRSRWHRVSSVTPLPISLVVGWRFLTNFCWWSRNDQVLIKSCQPNVRQELHTSSVSYSSLDKKLKNGLSFILIDVEISCGLGQCWLLQFTVDKQLQKLGVTLIFLCTHATEHNVCKQAHFFEQQLVNGIGLVPSLQYGLARWTIFI